LLNLPPGVTALQPGARVGPNGRYTVLEVLGAGANAVAYRASDSQRDGAEVALKALSLKSLRDWKQLDLFKREAETLRALNHPSIPALLDYFEEDSPDDRAFYIAQQAVPKGCATLAEMVANSASIGRPTDSEVLRLARDLLGVLDYLSSLRPPVVHRDIKPENIVIEGGRWGGKVYLVDFGGSVAAASSSSPEVVSGVRSGAAPPPLGSTIVGTYGYMAPEQFRGEASPASDLYALGATLLFMATGRAPSSFPQDGRMRVDLSGASRSLGPEVAELLDGLLEPLPEDRMTAGEALLVAGGGRKQQKKRKSSVAAAAPSPASPASALDQMMVRLPDGSLLPVTAVPAGRAALSRADNSNPLARGARKPAGTRVRLERTPGRLDVEIPPEGLGGQSIGAGLFALAWNGFVAFWTFSALASGGIVFALFSAPFWFAGAQLAQQALSGAFTRERLALGRRRFRLAQELATADARSGAAKFLDRAGGGGGGGPGAREVEGELEDLVGARIVTTVVVNGVPRTAVELVEGVRKHRFGEALDPAEQRWIVGEVDQFLEERRGRAVEERDFPAADPAEVVVEDDYLLDGGVGPSRGAFFSGRDSDDPFTTGDARSDPFLDRDDRFWGDRR
jgi:serine/threonine protein kinase